ncbi:MAG: hypothetical protein ACRDQ5_27330 [Sciscionella sp.]
MAKVKKMKKWGSRARLYAEQAEAAADRAEAALRRIAELTGNTAPGSPAGDAGGGGPATPRHSPAYTSPRGHDDTPPAAEVP